MAFYVVDDGMGFDDRERNGMGLIFAYVHD